MELDLALPTDGDAAYLPLLFGPDALDEDGSVAEILAASAGHAAALGQRLRERVYKDVVPGLAVAVTNRMNATSDADLAEAYQRTLSVLFRLLFVAHAEDRGLLPYQPNPLGHPSPNYATVLRAPPLHVGQQPARCARSPVWCCWQPASPRC
ncbi:MAG: hypothetical protein H0V32_13025 [Nocardioidaceae bacterium]|nr:hypothetical protein [Nocardioidaceae bacterium]MDQ3325691.1 hypothetical protein [Actinomycetota bacterium]